jgi:1-acyl-sn-glycerol-3-phosphate acyltransferase
VNFSLAILRLFGWKVEGGIPPALKKYVVVAAPHTSAWDFPLGLLARASIGADIRYIGKKSLFRPPLGWFMRKLGGYPVDRGKRQNLVQSVIDIFDRHEVFAIALAPEGTRRKVDKFRTGFYYIAKGAGIPIVFVTFDYGPRTVTFDPEAFYPTDDAMSDLEFIWNYYKGVQGKNPEWGINRDFVP